MLSRRRFLALAASAAALGGGYTLFEARRVGVTRLDLKLGLGLRAVHLTDTHFSTSVFSPAEVAAAITELDPELIFHTGDLLTYRRGLGEAVRFLEALRDTAPVYLVPGNHDHWSGVGAAGLKEALGSRGIVVLANSATGYGDLAIAGVDDPYTGRANLERALSGAEGEVRLLLAHSPQIIGEAAQRVELVLAGHTHGGQVRLHGAGALWLPMPREYRRFDYGLFSVGRARMFVSRGVGTGYLPVRLNCPPEIVLLSL
ncbi:MAG: metallophosphoesterase [Euryarchaeota archaeon]|nr:metallophosphoesterase [Euryarchaeota archaeon]